MTLVLKFLVSGVFAIMGVCAVVYRIDQPEYAKRDHAAWWAAVFFIVAFSAVFLL